MGARGPRGPCPGSSSASTGRPATEALATWGRHRRQGPCEAPDRPGACSSGSRPSSKSPGVSRISDGQGAGGPQAPRERSQVYKRSHQPGVPDRCRSAQVRRRTSYAGTPGVQARTARCPASEHWRRSHWPTRTVAGDRWDRTHAGPAVLPGGRRRSQGPTLSALLGHLQSDRDGPTAQGTGWHEASSDSPQGMEAGVLSTGHAKPEPRGGWAPGHRLCPPHCSVRQPGHRCPAQVGGGCPGPGCWWPRGEAARWPLEGCPAPAAAPRAWPPHRAGLPRAGRGCSGGGVSLASLYAPAAPIPDPAPPPRGGSAGGHKAKHGLAFHELAHTHHLVKIRRIVPDPQGN